MILMGLVTPLILYGRVIFSRSSRALLWSVFIEHKYQLLLSLGVYRHPIVFPPMSYY